MNTMTWTPNCYGLRLCWMLLASLGAWGCEQSVTGTDKAEIPVPSFALGDNVRRIVAANPQNCGVNIGVAFDGGRLLVSCLGRNVLDLIDPADGSLLGQLTVPGAISLTALAWDASRGKLFACNIGSDVILIDTSDGSSQFLFTTDPSGGFFGGCFDGLAFDGSDGTVWASADVSDRLNHYQTDGTLIASFTGLISRLGGFGNSGIASGAGGLFLANNGGQQIYTAPRDLSSVTLFATFPARLEDLECDDVTFSGSGITVIWSIDAFDRELNAWEIPPGSCPFGGGGGTITVAIDIKPSSDPNSINSNSVGVVPVAILGSADFDVTDVDVTTLSFGPAGALPVHDLTDPVTYAGHLQDVNLDGFTDLVSHYRQKETGLAPGDTEGCLTGATSGGRPIRGCDAVRVFGG